MKKAGFAFISFFVALVVFCSVLGFQVDNYKGAVQKVYGLVDTVGEAGQALVKTALKAVEVIDPSKKNVEVVPNVYADIYENLYFEVEEVRTGKIALFALADVPAEFDNLLFPIIKPKIRAGIVVYSNIDSISVGSVYMHHAFMFDDWFESTAGNVGSKEGFSVIEREGDVIQRRDDFFASPPSAETPSTNLVKMLDGTERAVSLTKYYEARHKTTGKVVLFGVLEDSSSLYAVVFSRVPEVCAGLFAYQHNVFGSVYFTVDTSPIDNSLLGETQFFGSDEGYFITQKQGNVFEVRDAYLSAT